MKKNNNGRRTTVLTRLEAQLEAGTKNFFWVDEILQVSLTEKDKNSEGSRHIDYKTQERIMILSNGHTHIEKCGCDYL